MANVQTNILIDENKKNLLKMKGLSLSDICRKAVDIAIMVDLSEKDTQINDLVNEKDKLTEKYIELGIKIENIEQQIMKLKSEKQEKDKQHDQDVEQMADSLIKQGALHNIG